MTSLMIQGAGSNVGKSLLVAGICRAFTLRGLTVRPFKPQNMSNNAAATPEGGEIGRAQALQARACGVQPHTDMNPVLLKPESETGAQVILQGKRLTTVKARDYAKLKPQLLPAVIESFNRLKAQADLVIVEGAGSPAEINLRAGDIANMGFARGAGVPVLLAGDIDRGGVIAQLVGTQSVLDPEDSRMIKGFLINKFRGDPSLFDEGLRFIERRTGWPSLGVAPWFEAAHKLPAEDAADIRPNRTGGALNIAALVLPRIANFDDLDPLAQEPGVSLRLLRPGEALAGDVDLVILPGSKSTLADLAALRRAGWDVDLAAHLRRGGRVLGICGGYQMMGRRIHDPEGLEGPPLSAPGLGFLDVETTMTPEKRVTPVTGRHRASGSGVTGYEIHLGRTSGPDCARAWLEIEGCMEGAASLNQLARGTYTHGLFASDGFRRAFLAELGAAPSDVRYEAEIEATLDALAAHFEKSLNLSAMLDIAREGAGS